MINQAYRLLLKKYGKQGWWPLIDKNLVVRHTGRSPKNNAERFEIVCGAILMQNTNWYPNVTRALQQLALGRLLKKEELEAVKEAEIIAGEISRNDQKITKRRNLTQNTNWKNVEKALYNLSKNKLLDLKKINDVKQEKLAQLIRPAGYYNQKAERLKIIANYLIKNYKGNIDNFFNFNKNKIRKSIKELRAELLNIKGIGPETADSIMLYSAEKPIFVIDAYAKRIFERLGIKKKSYDEWQQLFMDNLKHNTDLFKEYHALLVELGKRHCKTKPICKNCPIIQFCKYTLVKTSF